MEPPLNRRRTDANSTAQPVSARDSSDRRTAVYACGCIAVEADGVRLLECPTHAALQSKLRRRASDRA